MECTCAQTTPQFILSSERVFFKGMESEPTLTPREKKSAPEKFSSEEDRTHDVASSRTASPTHYQLSYSDPYCSSQDRPAAWRRGTGVGWGAGSDVCTDAHVV